jgi:hypothetical protein
VVRHSEARLVCPLNDCTPEEPGPAVYECSRCGNRDEERNCHVCGVFQAKVADESCPDCGEALEDDVFGEVTMWLAADGVWLYTEMEADDWDAAAPEREVARAEAAVRHEEFMAQYAAERRVEAEAALPLLHGALTAVRDAWRAAPQAEWTLDFLTGEAERGHPPTSVMLSRHDAITLLAPGLAGLEDAMEDYEDRERQDAARLELEKTLRPILGDDSRYYGEGATGVQFDALPLCTAIIEANRART